MGIFQLHKKQLLPIDKETLWSFISNPQNLREITPSYMDFEIKSLTSERMYEGMIIIYKVKPLWGIRMTWVTEITHIREHEYFVDEQRMGPYTLWHHEHKIETTDKGTLMTDIITYKPPLGILGTIANALFIRHQLRSIFDYREMVLEKKFGKIN